MDQTEWNSQTRKRILIDFDGVIHSYKSGWKGVSKIPDDPIPGAIAWLEIMMDHFDVSIFSVRCNELSGIDAMRSWFAMWGMDYQKLAALHFEPGKPAAHLIIDDRARQFIGAYPDPVSVDQFQPWYKGK